MRVVVRGVVVVLAFLYLGACSGTDVGLPRGQYAAAFASAMCSAAAKCCAAAGLAHDPSSCNSEQTQEFQFYLQAYGHNYSYDAQAAEACLKRFQASLAACVVPRALICAGVFVGNAPLGAACGENAECANDGLCSPRDTKPLPSTVCVSAAERPKNDLALGQPCGMAGHYCVSGAYCDNTGICLAQADSGSCQGEGAGENACTATAYCEGRSLQCMPRSPDGADCAGDWECLDNDCNATALGGASALTCGPQMVSSYAFGPCTDG
jgi:hypothetical protein